MQLESGIFFQSINRAKFKQINELEKWSFDRNGPVIISRNVKKQIQHFELTRKRIYHQCSSNRELIGKIEYGIYVNAIYLKSD